MYNLSSAEGARFSEICKDMNDRVKKLGFSPLNVDYKVSDNSINKMQEEFDNKITQ